MSQPDPWQTHLSYTKRAERNHATSMGADYSSTFVNPLHEGSSHGISPYEFFTETAMPPPPPCIDAPFVPHSKRNTGSLIAIVVLSVLVVALGSLEIMQQMVTHTPLKTYASVTTGSTQAGASSALRTSARQQTFPTRTVTPGTIKEHATLTCGRCSDPVLTTLTSITIDTTDRRLIFLVSF
jgi:hypothetical protein